MTAFRIVTQVFRLIALAILCGGSSAIVFAAVTFVHFAQAEGMTIAQAAQYNAPVFISFSKVALAAASVLLVTELLDFFVFAKRALVNKISLAAGLLCFLSCFVFAVQIVPSMEELRPKMRQEVSAYEAFQSLHHISQLVFAASIAFALVSLTAPAFKPQSSS
jgi:hypothetical protein